MGRHIDVARYREKALEEAAGELSLGLPIALPTETVYGLAADATDPAAIRRIYETKGRPQFNPLICHMADIAMAECYAVFDPVSRRLAEAFWPSPLTLVLPLKPQSGIHPLATAGLETIGIRVPRGFAGELIRHFGRPLAAPSANSSGKISPTSAAHVEADLGHKVNLILDGGAASVGIESTIVKVEANGRVRLLRPGGVVSSDIERVADVELQRPEKAAATIEAPGMLVSHYAPAAAVRLHAISVLPGEALIRFGSAPIHGEDKACIVLDLSTSGDLREAAANLFDYLKAADGSGADSIAVADIPAHGLGEAINDRLSRAAVRRS